MEQRPLTPADEKEIVSFVHTLPRPLYWELFATVTFRQRRGLFEASKAYHRWMDRTLPRVTHFWAVERNPSGDGGHHVHALWAGTEDLERREIWQKAFDQLGRARIEPIKSNEDVTHYCTKYAVKEGALIEWKLNKGCDYQRFSGLPRTNLVGPIGPPAPPATPRPGRTGWMSLAEYERRRGDRTRRCQQLPLSPNEQ